MFRYLLISLAFLPGYGIGQGHPSDTRMFRLHDATDRHTVIMENEAIPLPSKNDTTYSITITVTGIRNTNGVLRFKFYDDSTPFPDKKGFLRIVVPKSMVKNNTFTATYYGFPKRNMGIALHDDENENWELDMGWFLPNEGHAFGDYYHTALRRPVQSDFSFFLAGDKHVVMKMRYY